MGGDRGNGDGWSDPMDDDRLPEVFNGRLPEFFPVTFPAIFFVVSLIPPRLDGRAMMHQIEHAGPKRVRLVQDGAGNYRIDKAQSELRVVKAGDLNLEIPLAVEL